MLFVWLLAAQRAISQTGIALYGSEPTFFTGRQTAPEHSPPQKKSEQSPSSLWMQYFIEIYLEGRLSVSRSIPKALAYGDLGPFP